MLPKLRVYRITIEGEHALGPAYPTRQRDFREALELAANRLYGREGRDWRMVQDTTLIGFHVRALGGCDGEVLELR